MHPNKITIHCSDTPNHRKVTSEKIHKWHTQDRGWSAIGYHFVVLRDGQVDSRANKDFFRGLNEMGAHVRGNNKNNIGICLVGRNKFTMAQFNALTAIYDALWSGYEIPFSEIYCHN